MTMARTHLVNVAVTRWYHCIIRCVRSASLLGECKGNLDRKQWIEGRLNELSEIFAVSVGAFSVMDNQVHVLVRLDPDVAAGWSDNEVVRRWGRLVPPRDKSRQVLAVTNEWVKSQRKDARCVAIARERLQSLSWFMKCLKEPLARLANRQDNARGAFFEERFKSIAILDDQSLLASLVLIDLSPVAAGIVDVPEASPHTSVFARAQHVKAKGRTAALQAAGRSAARARKAPAGLEETIWLCPIEDRGGRGSSRRGMLEGFSLRQYLLLVDYTGRLFREGKAPVSAELAGIFQRLGSSADHWQVRLEKLKAGRLLGRFFAGTRARLREAAVALGVHHLANLDGCAVG